MKYSMKMSFTSTENKKTKFKSVLKITYEPIENQPFIIGATWRKSMIGSSAYYITLQAKSFKHIWETANKYTEDSFVLMYRETKEGYQELTIIFRDSFGAFDGFFNPELVND